MRKQRVLSMVVLLLLAMFVVACGNEAEEPVVEDTTAQVQEPVEEDPPAPTEEPVEEEPTTDLEEPLDEDATTDTEEPLDEDALEESVDEILDDPDRFYGQTVTITAEIGRFVGPSALTVEEDALLAEETMLVLDAGEVIPTLGMTEDDSVRVVGQVRPLVVAEIEEEFGFDLDEDLLVEFEERPVLVADVIEAIEPLDIAADPDDDDEEAGDITLDDIAEEPMAYYGQTVTVTGELGELMQPNGFTLEDSDLGPEETVLVLSADIVSELGLSEDDTVQVMGTVQPMDLADVEEELGVDLNDDVYREFDGRPVIIATDAHPVG